VWEYGIEIDDEDLLSGVESSGDDNFYYFTEDNNVNNYKVARNSCTLKHFACNSGQCIDTMLACDGTQDCQDGSDEINCYHNYNS